MDEEYEINIELSRWFERKKDDFCWLVGLLTGTSRLPDLTCPAEKTMPAGEREAVLLIRI